MYTFEQREILKKYKVKPLNTSYLAIIVVEMDNANNFGDWGGLTLFIS